MRDFLPTLAGLNNQPSVECRVSVGRADSTLDLCRLLLCFLALGTGLSAFFGRCAWHWSPVGGQTARRVAASAQVHSAFWNIHLKTYTVTLLQECAVAGGIE